jgi:uncharacterized damage-inducible protein DinB
VLRTHSLGFESHSRISFGAFIEREGLMKRSCVLAASVTRKNRITRSVVGIAYTAKFRKRFEGNAKEGAKDRLRSPLASAILLSSCLVSSRRLGTTVTFSQRWSDVAFSEGRLENLGMAHQFTTSYLKDAIDLFRYYKRLADGAIAQCPDDKLCAEIDPESNSVSIIVKHMAGNMRSRWSNFLTTDGEKPDRRRDTEFEDAPATRAEVMALWDAGWNYLFDALTSLTDADLSRTVTIRTEPHSVTQAINRQVAHYSYHVGQIVYVARHFAGSNWRTLTIPKKKSGEFNAQVASGEKSQR